MSDIGNIQLARQAAAKEVSEFALVYERCKNTTTLGYNVFPHALKELLVLEAF